MRFSPRARAYHVGLAMQIGVNTQNPAATPSACCQAKHAVGCALNAPGGYIRHPLNISRNLRLVPWHFTSPSTPSIISSGTDQFQRAFRRHSEPKLINAMTDSFCRHLLHSGSSLTWIGNKGVYHSAAATRSCVNTIITKDIFLHAKMFVFTT